MKIWNSYSKLRTPAEWALKWLWNEPAVGVVLSGMSTMEQVEQNLKSAERAAPKSLNLKELELISQVKDMYTSKIKVGCTGCMYCMPCPNGVAIPVSFSYYNNAFMFEDVEGQKKAYNTFVKEDNRASRCVECGKCEELCPQSIPIIEKLKEVVALFE